MSKKYLYITVVFFLYLPLAYAGWPKVAMPPQSTEASVADKIRVNGLEMQITHFKSFLSPREILAYYRNKWSAQFDESVHGQWQQISRLEAKYFITIQVRDEGFSNSFGRINILNLSEKPAEVGKDTPMMLDSKILNEVITKDKATVSTVTLIANKFSTEQNRQYYENYFKQKGWNIVMAKSAEQKFQTMVFRKNRIETTITVNKFNSGSSIVLNQVEKRQWFN